MLSVFGYSGVKWDTGALNGKVVDEYIEKWPTVSSPDSTRQTLATWLGAIFMAFWKPSFMMVARRYREATVVGSSSVKTAVTLVAGCLNPL